MNTQRFSKAAVISALRHRSQVLADVYGFDPFNDYTQLTNDKELYVLVSRAVDYGRMLAYEHAAKDIEDGYLCEVME